MTSYLPDINVWLALSWGGHIHSPAVWDWFRTIGNDEILYCRFTQLGLLRLLTTQAVMGDDCLTVRKAWDVYDQWLRDPKVLIRNEPADVDDLFRQSTLSFARLSSPKVLGDCYLLAMSSALNANLVTLDTGLASLARKLRQDVVQLG